MGSKVAVTSPIPAEFAVADINRLLFDLNSAFNPLHPGCQLAFQVSEVKDGYVHLSMALPEGMTRAYITLLESLNGLFRCMDIKSRSVAAQTKVHDLTVHEQNLKRVADFEAKVLDRYDRFITAGYDSADAIKRTNTALKNEGENMAYYEWVKSVIRKAGRLRKQRKKQG